MVSSRPLESVPFFKSWKAPRSDFPVDMSSAKGQTENVASRYILVRQTATHVEGTVSGEQNCMRVWLSKMVELDTLEGELNYLENQQGYWIENISSPFAYPVGFGVKSQKLMVQVTAYIIIDEPKTGEA